MGRSVKRPFGEPFLGMLGAEIVKQVIFSKTENWHKCNTKFKCLSNKAFMPRNQNDVRRLGTIFSHFAFTACFDILSD
jgi:hypothetical protein